MPDLSYRYADRADVPAVVALVESAYRGEETVIRQREALIAWYERRGYQRTGELKSFPYGDESVGAPRRAIWSSPPWPSHCAEPQATGRSQRPGGQDLRLHL